MEQLCTLFRYWRAETIISIYLWRKLKFSSVQSLRTHYRHYWSRQISLCASCWWIRFCKHLWAMLLKGPGSKRKDKYLMPLAFLCNYPGANRWGQTDAVLKWYPERLNWRCGRKRVDTCITWCVKPKEPGQRVSHTPVKSPPSLNCWIQTVCADVCVCELKWACRSFSSCQWCWRPTRWTSWAWQQMSVTPPAAAGCLPTVSLSVPGASPSLHAPVEVANSRGRNVNIRQIKCDTRCVTETGSNTPQKYRTNDG